MKKITLVSLILLGVFITQSCIKNLIDPDDTNVSPNATETEKANSEVNSWIYDSMKSYYLWTDNMKPKNKTNLILDPETYFDSILYQKDTTDRFSWIQENVEELTASLNGQNTVLGIRSSPIYADNAKTRLAFAVAYTLKNSPAERAGIKRGDFITQVNGVDLTLSNYQKALEPQSVKLTLGQYLNGEISSTSTIVSVTKEELQTNPIQHASVIEYDGKKIAYLVYLQFLSSFDEKIRTAFADFKAKGVTELVLDLRYNPGGYISSSEIISSLIVKNLNTNNVMSRQVWNNNWNSKYGTSSYFKNEANNLGTLNRVYILTSNGTASASELIINNLKPYMDVILIGEHTYGKNVGSVTLSDKDKRWKWGMQPIVLKTVNSKGDSDYGTKLGFLPTYEVKDNKIPYFQFGDIRETLLKVAIENITGKTIATTDPNGRKIAQKAVERTKLEFIYDNPALDKKEMFYDNISISPK
jgi:carboxyl-terminal processing protease